MKQIQVRLEDYDRLLKRAGIESKIHYVVKALLDLSELAAADIQKWNEWSQAVGSTTLPHKTQPPPKIAEVLKIPLQDTEIETIEEPSPHPEN